MFVDVVSYSLFGCFLFMCMFVSEDVNMSVHCVRGQKRGPGLLEIELDLDLSCLVGVLGPKLGLAACMWSAFSCWAIFQPPDFLLIQKNMFFANRCSLSQLWCGEDIDEIRTANICFPHELAGWQASVLSTVRMLSLGIFVSFIFFGVASFVPFCLCVSVCFCVSLGPTCAHVPVDIRD